MEIIKALLPLLMLLVGIVAGLSLGCAKGFRKASATYQPLVGALEKQVAAQTALVDGLKKQIAAQGRLSAALTEQNDLLRQAETARSETITMQREHIALLEQHST